MKSEEIYQGLKDANSITGKYNLSPGEIKPCIAKIMSTPFQEGDCPSRSIACNIICSEMLRIGMPEPEINSVLYMWNGENNPPLKKSELSSALRTATNKLRVGGYNYGCNNKYLGLYCVNGFCQFKENVGDFRYSRNRDFFSFGWSKLLSPAEQSLYHALIEFERRKGAGAGGLLILTHRQISTISISLKSVGIVLNKLKNYGLIEYTPGTQRKWQKRASEIRRVIPIPKPNKQQANKIESKKRAVFGKTNDWQ